MMMRKRQTLPIFFLMAAALILGVATTTAITDVYAHEEENEEEGVSFTTPTATPRIEYVQLESSSAVSNLTAAATATQETRDIITQVQNECTAEGLSPIGCVWPIYESPTTVVFEGDKIVSGQGGTSNKWIWKVVDNLKARGFVIDSILLAGEGTRGNPHVFEIVMSRSQ